MAKYHISPETGKPGLCRATKQCPFGDASEHYPSKAEAQGAYEAKMEAELAAVLQGTKLEEAHQEVYDFRAGRVGDALKSIEKANRKAERAGIKERIGYELEEYSVESMDEHGFMKIEERVRLTLDKPQLQHDGWTFAGTMSWDEEVGLVTRMAPGGKLLAKPRASECDVCHTTRHRNDTYIVTKGGQQQQVGSNCLKQFMGIKPAGLWMMEYDLDEFREKDEDDLGGGSYSEPWRDQRKDSREMLALGLAMVEEYGWTSRSASSETRTPTVDIMESFFRERPKSIEDRADHERIAARAMELTRDADSLLQEARSMEGDSDYAQNLRTVASGESVSMRNLPLLVSAIAASNARKAKDLEREAKKLSNFVGTPGEKITALKVTVEDTRTIENHYGYNATYSTLVTMRDEQGNVLKWFKTSGGPVEKGKQYTLDRATVKKHEEYQGVKQTLLTRAKFGE